MLIKIKSETYSRLENIVQSIQKNTSVDLLAESILCAYLNSTHYILNEASEMESLKREADQQEVIEIEDLPVKGSIATNFYLAFALKAYLGLPTDAKLLNVSDEEVNNLLTKFKKEYPPVPNERI
jgi:hypothetical protein